MSLPVVDLTQLLAATWPPLGADRVGPFLVPEGGGGGSRVSAARLADPEADLARLDVRLLQDLRRAQRRLGQADRVMVLGPQTALDAALEAEGYVMRDATDALIAPVAALADAPPPARCFEIWPPLAIQAEIWEAAGIGDGRRAVMGRATGPKTSLLARLGDRPAGTAFVAFDGDIAVVHALEVARAARRNGLARMMMGMAAHWAASQGARHLAVLVTRENSPAQMLYASLGMQPVGHYHYRLNEGGPAPT